MLERKPFAALSSGLLARKGQAKPAMRRQFTPFEDFHHDSVDHDDLGWNDMGDDHDHGGHDHVAHGGADNVSPAAPSPAAPSPVVAPLPVERAERAPAPVSSLHEQQDRLAASFGKLEAPQPAKASAAAAERGDDLIAPGAMNGLVRRPVYEAVLDRLRGERRVALTLRIGRDRHALLRELIDRTGTSAQALLARAVDEFIDRELPAHRT